MRATKCSDHELEDRIPLLDFGRHREESREESVALRMRRYMGRINPAVKDFSVSLQKAFSLAEQEVPTISVKRSILGGTPCIDGTRVPVYMILDAIEYCGSLEGAAKSYPRLSIQQIRDAVRYSKVVLECCIEH